MRKNYSLCGKNQAMKKCDKIAKEVMILHYEKEKEREKHD